MKVTKPLLEWLQIEFDRQELTYAELARRGNTNYQNFQKLLQGRSTEITQVMIDAICKAFGISEIDLIKISRGEIEHIIKEDDGPAYKTKRPVIDLSSMPKEAQEHVMRTCFEENITPTEYVNNLIRKAAGMKS